MTQESKIQQTMPRSTVQVTFPDQRIYEGPVGTTVEDFITRAFADAEIPFMAALVNGNLRELSYEVNWDSEVEPLQLSQSDGVRIYRRSLTFMLVVAMHRLWPDAEVFVDHSLPFGGYYCEVHKREPLSDEELTRLGQEMRDMVASDLPIQRCDDMPLEQALTVFHDRDEWDKVAVFAERDRRHKSYLRLYCLDGYKDYLHGYMVPSTRYLKYFQLSRWEDGFIMQFPRRHEPTRLQEPIRAPQLLNVFHEYGDWLKLLGTRELGGLNQAIHTGRIQELILVCEALQERRIADIANHVAEHSDTIQLVTIAGPSSSGKTTFSKRLAVQLLSFGVRPFALELDNYFVNREDTPLDENGEYDFESLVALDLARFNADLVRLLAGEQVQLPKFNFITGIREHGRIVQLKPGQIVIIEGIHGLNPQLVTALPKEAMYRLYVSALTQLNLDRHNRVPTTDTRLIRRIVRDAGRRGYTATDTIKRWESVRRGEKRYIFPYQENADVMFNSALVYELAVLKPFVEPLLLQVEPGTRPWIEAKRLLTFLQWFQPVDTALVPENSILREFIGGLSLDDFHWE